MSTLQNRIVEPLESEVERLTLERDDLKEEIRIIKKMLEDAQEELKKEAVPKKYVSRDDQMLPDV